MSNTITVSAGWTLTSNGGQEYLTSGTTTNTTYTPTAADLIKVQSGGTTSNVVIGTGGVLSASSGSTEIGTVVSSGGIVDQVNLGTFISNPITVVSGAEIELAWLPQSSTIYPTSFSVTSSGGNEVISATNGARTMSVTVSGTPAFSYQTVGTKTGIVFTGNSVTCFGAGTAILTEQGEVAVESVKPGDMVTVRRDGRDVPEPVMWVGYSSVDLRRHAHPELAAPIRIAAGALAEGLPVRDLVVSPEHCMIVDGHCVPAKLLVNGTTIVREYPQTPFMYYHIELERHGILIADGAEAESYLDTGNRASFDNAGEPRLLHPTFQVNADAARWKTEACAPLATAPEDVAPIWRKLADRAIALGFELPKVEAVEDPDLHLIVDGRRIEAVSDREARFVFAVPAGAKSVVLASRASILADQMTPLVRDTRRIGVRVLWAAIRSGDSETILPGDHPALRQGWHQVDTHGSAPWRWTNGAATIPWENIDGAAMLTVHCYASGWYPVEQGAVLAA